jgi:uncharacterized protein YdcH (DUF465 family)
MDALAEARERLIQSDPQFRRLARKHEEYEQRLERIRANRFPTEEEKTEEATLKKLKLAVKDQMEQILRLQRA